MRKILVLEHISLDGVIQGPGGSDEDRSGGFAHGGWTAGYSDSILGERLRKKMDSQFDLLLGRGTYEIWAPYWPHHVDFWPNANTATKFVASNTLTSGEWHPTEILSGDIVEKIRKLKTQEGRDLHVWGSSNLVQTLLKHDLVDAFWLLIYPVTLGTGKRLFSDGAIKNQFRLSASKASAKGVILAEYVRAAEP